MEGAGAGVGVGERPELGVWLTVLLLLLGDRKPSPSIPPRDQGCLPLFAGETGLGSAGGLLLLFVRVSDAVDDDVVNELLTGLLLLLPVPFFSFSRWD